MSFSFGSGIRYELYGASHEPYIGIRMTGIPAGESVDAQALYAFMLRRARGVPPIRAGGAKPTFPCSSADLKTASRPAARSISE